MKNFRICQKLNYASETKDKQKKVDQVSAYIYEKMTDAGFEKAQEKEKKVDFVFSIGGDGTMMHSMREHLYKNSIIIGVNAGNVGFLTPYSLDDILSSDVVSIIKTPRVEKRNILAHRIGKNKGYAINDYAITAHGPNDMMEFSIEIEHAGQINRAGRYRANAMVLSGPSGSTAYNMNAGGAIVDPVVKCMQIVMIAPTTLGTRPLIISKDSKIHVITHSKAKAFADGILIQDIDPSENLRFTVSLLQKESQIMVPKDWNFFSALAEKLHWNNGKEV